MLDKKFYRVKKKSVISLNCKKLSLFVIIKIDNLRRHRVYK